MNPNVGTMSSTTLVRELRVAILSDIAVGTRGTMGCAGTFLEGKAEPRSENGLVQPKSNFGAAKKDRRVAFVKLIVF